MLYSYGNSAWWIFLIQQAICILAYTVLFPLLKRVRGGQKAVNHPDVLAGPPQGMWVLLRTIRASCWEVSEEMYPLFLCGRLNNSHYTCSEKLYVHGKTKSIMGCPHPLATGQEFLCTVEGLFQRQRPLSHDGKEMIALIGPNGQNRWNCGPTILFDFFFSPLLLNGTSSSWGRTLLSFLGRRQVDENMTVGGSHQRLY